MGESFLDLADDNLADAVEPKAADEGEYTIRLTDWRTDKKGSIIQKDRNDNPYILPIFEIIECEEAEFAKGFSHFLRIPYDGMDSKERNGAKWELKTFFECMGIDYTGRIDYEECIGNTGDVLLVVTEDEGYGEQNKIKKFLTAR